MLRARMHILFEDRFCRWNGGVRVGVVVSTWRFRGIRFLLVGFFLFYPVDGGYTNLLKSTSGLYAASTFCHSMPRTGTNEALHRHDHRTGLLLALSQ